MSKLNSDSFSNNNNFKYNGRDLESMSFAQNYHNWIYNVIAPSLGNNIAEIGSGVGNFTKFLLKNSHSYVHAYEPCAIMHKSCTFLNHNRVNCLNKNFETEKESKLNYFDSVVFINVLEHIQRDYQAIEASFEILKKGGKLVIFVPALNSLYSEFDKSVGHFRRYQKKHLIRLLSNKGVRIQTCNYFDCIGIIPWFIFIKVFRSGLNPSRVKAYDSLIVPWLCIIEKLIAPPIGKNLLAIATK